MRRELTVSPIVGSNEQTTYMVWIEAEFYDAVRDAVAKTGHSWPVWVGRAINSFCMLEEDERIRFMQAWQRSREGKKALSIRLFKSTLKRCKELAKQYDGSVQQVIAHALFVQMLKDSAAQIASDFQ